jgi:hypothetical protein
MLERAIVGLFGVVGKAARRQLPRPQVVLQAIAADPFSRTGGVAAIARFHVAVLLALHGCTSRENAGGCLGRRRDAPAGPGAAGSIFVGRRGPVNGGMGRPRPRRSCLGPRRSCGNCAVARRQDGQFPWTFRRFCPRPLESWPILSHARSVFDFDGIARIGAKPIIASIRRNRKVGGRDWVQCSPWAVDTSARHGSSKRECFLQRMWSEKNESLGSAWFGRCLCRVARRKRSGAGHWMPMCGPADAVELGSRRGSGDDLRPAL